MNKDFIEIEADNLIKVVQLFADLGGEVDKSAQIRQSIRSASSYLVRKTKTNLKSSLKGQSKYLVNSPTYKLKKRNSGALVGFKPLIYIAQKNSVRLSGAPWWIDRGTRERNGRGRIKATGFFEDVRQIDAPVAMNMISNSVEASINKILSRNI